MQKVLLELHIEDGNYNIKKAIDRLVKRVRFDIGKVEYKILKVDQGNNVKNTYSRQWLSAEQNTILQGFQTRFYKHEV